MTSSKFGPPTVIIESCLFKQPQLGDNRRRSFPHSISIPDFSFKRDTYRDLRNKLCYSTCQLNRKAQSCSSLSFITTATDSLKSSLFRPPSPSPSSNLGHFLDPRNANAQKFKNISGSTLGTQTASSSRFSLYESFFDLSDNGQEKYRTLEEKRLFDPIILQSKYHYEQCDDFQTKCNNWLQTIERV
ncbi:unnamed protein product [Didymodactylos carnosus]|uniref:Uncharacterized protein n=1 Tax=Didymodactylos carnosus TaxID=1234261 RepID=A0A814BV47_9BILA|nr:unnamed protein product [Didymodactylos carnosus]CAF1320197.1 unnamed protein product [Didymodactylos carnosus]CAF3711501.1 unnamed protein product [Didymodactylos carnosus]CAF4130079.1 unnamed protein product [Didymodactylos carnosus]